MLKSGGAVKSLFLKLGLWNPTRHQSKMTLDQALAKNSAFVHAQSATANRA